jgi:uncharacterized Zn finger protein (UPF0148 family)
MGLYTIGCPTCGAAHYWFSGNLDQRCPTCQKEGKTERLSQAKLDEIREQRTQLAPEQLSQHLTTLPETVEETLARIGK